MRSMLKLLFLFAFISNTFAAYVAVLETVAAPDVTEKVSLSDRQFLTNVLREQAVMELPAEQNFTIMTRENINAMLPPGKSIEDCEGNCMVETGRNIAADYVCQMHLGSFDGAFSLSAELYETAANKLIASFNSQGSNLKDLLNIIKEKSPKFFHKIKRTENFTDSNSSEEKSKKGKYNLDGKKIFSVEVASFPSEAFFTIDGKTSHKCQNTPCKLLLEEGTHRFIASKDRYTDAEAIINIIENDQKIALKLEPNFGLLMINPKFEERFAKKASLNVMVDDNRVAETRIQLDPGIHNVRVTHPCYDPVEFKVSIEKQATEVFDKAMTRGKGGLELNVEYNGEPQAVTVLIDGEESGSTPYTGEVPLCADIKLKGNGWIENVDVTPKWHEVMQVTHKLQHSPESVAIIEDATRAKANAAYAEHEGKPISKVGESIPANVENSNSKTAKWVILGVGSAATVTGIALAIAGNSQAKKASKKEYSSKSEFKKYRKDATSGQTLRGVGIGLAIAGAVGIGVSFTF